MAVQPELKRHNLRDHPEFGALLEKIAGDINPSLPSGQVTVHFSDGGTQHAFRLDPESFSVIDAGRPVNSISCVVCRVNSRRQYGFFVRCVDGTTRGPIGSACIFEHVLGTVRARGYGVRMRTLVGELAHYQRHHLWLQEAQENYDEYLRRASLAYLSDKRLQVEAKLTRTQRELLAHLRLGRLPLPPDLYDSLLRHGEHLPVPVASPTPVEAELDRPLSPELRVKAQQWLPQVLQELPSFTRDYAKRAIEQDHLTVDVLLRKLLMDAIQHVEQIQIRGTLAGTTKSVDKSINPKGCVALTGVTAG